VRIVFSRHLNAFNVAGLVLCSGLFAACAEGREFSGPLPMPDGQGFVNDVYPVLLRDCAFVACHGAPDRFFRVYGPGRVRLDVLATKPDDPLTLQEILYSYDRSRSMLATADTIQNALLLSKPLEPAAGGQGHKGVDELGRNVFASVRDPSYAVLATWARSKGSPPTAAQVEAANLAAEMVKEGAP
jgi:hypothetical protein